MKTNHMHPNTWIIIIFILIFSIIGYVVDAQSNSLSISVQPGDKGIGLRYDYKTVYTSVTWGNYSFDDCGYIKNHIKSSIGYKYFLPVQLNSNAYHYATFGVNYHWYGDKKFIFSRGSKYVLCPISFDLGTGFKIADLNFAMRFDILKWEGCIDFGFNF